MKESSSKTNSLKQRIRPVERINSKSKTKKEQIIKIKKNKRTRIKFSKNPIIILGLNQNLRISSQSSRTRIHNSPVGGWKSTDPGEQTPKNLMRVPLSGSKPKDSDLSCFFRGENKFKIKNQKGTNHKKTKGLGDQIFQEPDYFSWLKAKPTSSRTRWDSTHL